MPDTPLASFARQHLESDSGFGAVVTGWTALKKPADSTVSA